MYAGAVPSRINPTPLGMNASEDSELLNSLRNLRAKSRLLVRDAAFAKNARRVIVNNVIGTGIKLQAVVMNQRRRLLTDVNDSIEDAWRIWSEPENCHTGGVLHFSELERLAMGEVFEAGEVFIRIHRQPFGPMGVPLALEIIEPERLLDGYVQPTNLTPSGGAVRMGVELDSFHRPIAYHIRDLHPGDHRMINRATEKVVRVPASEIIHLKITDRWPQTRGVPWMHAVVQKLGDMNGYTEAEIIAARAAANYVGVLESPEDSDSLAELQEDGSYQMAIEPGTWYRTRPGEKADLLNPSRPNSQLDPFMRFMLREVAAGAGLSYESLGRDYSQSNYSSSRLALLDDRDVWRALQQWFIRSFRVRLHREWLQAAVLSGNVAKVGVQAYALDRQNFEAAIMRPRGWSWVDPTKEVAAYKEAVKSGFTTVSAVIAQTSGGEDVEDIVTTRKSELEYFREEGLVFDTSPEVFVTAETSGAVQVDPEDGTVELAPEPAPAKAPAPKAGTDPESAPSDEEGDDAKRTVVQLNRDLKLRRQRHV